MIHRLLSIDLIPNKFTTELIIVKQSALNNIFNYHVDINIPINHLNEKAISEIKPPI